MDLLANGPAALGGLLISVAMGGWTLGRWQGGFAALDDARAPAGRDTAEAGALSALPGIDVARTRRAAALAAADSLGELHAEISAYRRAEQVFASSEADGLQLCPPGEAVHSGSDMRQVGAQGRSQSAEPACDDCSCAVRCALADPPRSGPAEAGLQCQPPLADPGLTRV
ncbi:hypothetical protein [Erythrobacter sp. CCH5-A1]|jgi:hypothetical protein|uniref:hypothetical protein n=1 Tax=Erythrobacter sp. CCH5-A1 TaxID=1768792 RepID=UPI0012E3DDCA|nr:hypothetical protein [Erythrobacter sp. CCH5-A1]